MMRRKVVIPKGLKCPDCGNIDANILIGAGHRWKTNPNNGNPPRIIVQQYKCNKCGKIFAESIEVDISN